MCSFVPEKRPRHSVAAMEALCDTFEAGWRQGLAPRIEDFQSSLPVEEYRALLCKMLHIEWRARHAARDAPQLSEYLERFGNEAALVEAAWRRWQASTPGRATAVASGLPVDARALRSTIAKSGVGADPAVARTGPRDRGAVECSAAAGGRESAMGQQLRLAIYWDQNLVFSVQVAEPVELGRQCAGEDPPFAVVRRGGQTRIIVAPIDDTSVSRRYVLCQLEAGQVRVTNLSDARSVNLSDASRVKPGQSRVIAPNVMLVLGERVVRFEPPAAGE